MRLRQDANGKSRHTENSYYIFHAYPLSTPPGKIRRKQGLNFTLRDSQRKRPWEMQPGCEAFREAIEDHRYKPGLGAWEQGSQTEGIWTVLKDISVWLLPSQTSRPFCCTRLCSERHKHMSLWDSWEGIMDPYCLNIGAFWELLLPKHHGT